MHAKTLTRIVGLTVVASLVTAGCGDGGDDDDSAPAPGDAVGEAVATGDDEGDEGVAQFPVTVRYAGVDWVVDDARAAVDEDGEPAVEADLSVTNTNPFGMSWPLDVLRLEAADGTVLELDSQAGTGSRDLDVDGGATATTTLTFTGDAGLTAEVADLTLVVAETGRIAASAPFAGSPTETGYPVEADFTGTTAPLALHEGDAYVATVGAVSARIDLDGPGVRAEEGGRLAVIDVGVAGLPGNASRVLIVEENFVLDVDGVGASPRSFIEETPERTRIASVDPGATEGLTLVFDVPRDATQLTLVIRTDEGAATADLPLDVGELPACCGE
jgi:hypothetical protein